MLFTTISQLKTHIGGGTNVSLELDSINPTFQDVADIQLRPYLGQTTLDALAAYVAADYTPTDTALDALLPLVRAPLAAFGVVEYSKIGNLQFGEAGLFRMESDDKRTPYKYQETEYRNTLRTQGYNALERMIVWLEKHKADYPDWVAEARKYCLSLFVSLASDLRGCYSAQIDRQTYEVLRPLLEDMETFLILSSIGQAQFDALKTMHLSASTPLNYNQLEGLRRIRKAIGLGAIQENLRRGIIQIKEGRLTQVEALEPQSYLKEGVPSNQALSLSSVHLQEWKERHLSYALAWLQAHPTEFPEYADYLAAIAEAEAAAAASTGDPLRSPTPERSLPYIEQEYTPSTGTGIINF
jgi:hypothetical protein